MILINSVFPLRRLRRRFPKQLPLNLPPPACAKLYDSNEAPPLITHIRVNFQVREGKFDQCCRTWHLARLRGKDQIVKLDGTITIE